MTKGHILIVDDDKNMLKMLRMFLVDDYNVTIVDSGKLALEAVIKKTPDLILLDYMMPLFDGPHVLEIIRKREESKNVPVLFLTSVTDREKILECLSLNPQGYLVKPISREELLQRVDEVLNPLKKIL
ncbi:Response regulator receiver domain-containing protein [Lachnospiraceae bacterium YSD2013]|nr:response regulator [Lachnospiraceae bacterium]SCX03555.1 Response regulator receiver domain-containing protein [Lachnospiraceae bacterium YSD2013]MBO4824604.1 response regulator [Lachnospiraceae bacterium]MBR5762674.1 response regulator [Lachnospiraceae bacterium]MBR5994221.1 response regulator [Lachnospiraceae bacterium]